MKTIILTLTLYLVAWPIAWGQPNPRQVLHGIATRQNPNPAAAEQTVPIAGARAMWEDGSDTATTDADGRFELAPPLGGLPAVLHLTAEGYQAESIRIERPERIVAAMHPATQPTTESGINGVVRWKRQGPNATTEPEAAVGVQLAWLGTAVGTISHTDGSYTLPPPPAGYPHALLASFLGAHDTIWVEQSGNLNIEIEELTSEAIQIVARQRSTSILDIETRRVELISAQELTHAACCNLSEAFETNPSVDVGYTDAVTGAKEIQMLGLAGIYTQILSDNMPFQRGLGRTLGLNFVPGPWLAGIAVTKGIGSATYGYESMAGQLNVLYQPPHEGPRLLLNGYGNSLGRAEVNAVARKSLPNDWHANLMLHASGLNQPVDHNADGFQDTPEYQQVNVYHSWMKKRPDNTETHVGFNVVYEGRQGGQTAYDHRTSAEAQPRLWGLNLQTRRAEGFYRMGFRPSETKPWQSWALHGNAVVHEQRGFFGHRGYVGYQRQGWLKGSYASIIGNTNHRMLAGPSLLLDDVRESLGTDAWQLAGPSVALQRQEAVPGAYAEYTGKWGAKATVVASLRADYSSVFGLFAVPRLHVKYDFTENTTLRLGGGRGWHASNLLAENVAVLSSGRQIAALAEPAAEVAWNWGISLLRNFRLGRASGYFCLDAYRTDFEQQVVLDLDADPMWATFQVQRGQSFSNAAQAELMLEPVEWLNFKVAYKFYDVRAMFNGQLLQRPMVPMHRAFFTATLDRPRWMLNFTTQWFGPQRLPSTHLSPTETLRRPDWSPAFFRLLGQFTYRLGAAKAWEVYAGGENLTNFTVANAIVSPNQPFSHYFDTSMAWGPVLGRVVYVGFRWTLE